MEKLILDAYFAGLIDGEGNVAIYSCTTRGCTRPRPVIKVDMTCEKTILALHSHFGGYIGIKKTPTKNKPQWRWEVTFNRAIEVCERIAPFLITKSDAAHQILQCKPRKQGRPSKQLETAPI